MFKRTPALMNRIRKRIYHATLSTWDLRIQEKKTEKFLVEIRNIFNVYEPVIMSRIPAIRAEIIESDRRI
jgi:hypothetical protein